VEKPANAFEGDDLLKFRSRSRKCRSQAMIGLTSSMPANALSYLVSRARSSLSHGFSEGHMAASIAMRRDTTPMILGAPSRLAHVNGIVHGTWAWL